MFKALQNSLLSVLYPQDCRVCSRQVERLEEGVACSDCWDSTCFFSGHEMLCGRCGALLGALSAPDPVFCRKCDDHFYRRAVAAGVYEKALAASIIHLKSSPVIPTNLKAAISNALARLDTSGVELIIPIPLSKKRLIERGFNQAETIAVEIGRQTGIAVDSCSLVRKVHTPIHRIGMDQKARELTVKNAFEIARPKLIAAKNILLVDDVLTSGSTASYCAKALKKSGAGCVDVFTLARAVMK